MKPAKKPQQPGKTGPPRVEDLKVLLTQAAELPKTPDGRSEGEVKAALERIEDLMNKAAC